MAKHRAFVVERINAAYPKGLGYWSVLDRFDDRKFFLGWVLLLPYGSYLDEVEIGWRFNYDAWGKGYAKESASRVLDHAFKTARLKKIVADIDPSNLSSINVAEKLGMRYVEDRCINGEMGKSYQIDSSQYLGRL